ncbi:sugar transferase [Limosilactobacillus vaginalis]|uniref:sugar transferase n=1 Tax=Limosilactobacillus vaginalis TaxID=1633 RepID=UPI0022E2EE7C|nr:sugar transferase [Limosilactobacillus vaginalis]
MMQMQVSSEKDNDNKNEVEQSFKWYRDFFKRGFDIFFSLVAIIILAIPMMIIALWIKIDSPHEKVLFKQERIGINNVPFTILKFRSMRDDAPHQMATENFENPEMYITRVGKILRKTSLDELPQLLNVLKGDMSIVGPRPLIPKEKYVLKLRDEYGANKILPGITGLAQVHGRDQVTDENKASYDGKYALNVSLLLDASIIMKTVSDVVRSRGIREGGQVQNVGVN